MVWIDGSGMLRCDPTRSARRRFRIRRTAVIHAQRNSLELQNVLAEFSASVKNQSIESPHEMESTVQEPRADEQTSLQTSASEIDAAAFDIPKLDVSNVDLHMQQVDKDEHLTLLENSSSMHRVEADVREIKRQESSDQSTWDSWLDPWDWLPVAAVSKQHFEIANKWADNRNAHHDAGGHEQLDRPSGEVRGDKDTSFNIVVSSPEDLSADDVLDHFEQFGPVHGIGIYHPSSSTGSEQWIVFFKRADSVVSALQHKVHRIFREYDSELVAASIYHSLNAGPPRHELSPAGGVRLGRDACDQALGQIPPLL